MKNLLSFSSVKLALFSKENVALKPASGFVLEADHRYFLITNRHVIADSKPPAEDGEQAQAMKPYLLKTSLHIHGGQGDVTAPFSTGIRKRVTLPLYDEDESPQWLECRNEESDGWEADLIALPIRVDLTLRLFSAGGMESNVDKNPWARDMRFWSKVSSIPISAIDTEVEYQPPDAVYIIGYPLGWAPEGPDRSSSAFWRTGFIASEMYESGSSHLNTFFIDPPAPEGMSGSPVVGLKNDRLKLLGVYSDRSTTEFAAHAGLAWEAYLLKNLIGAI